MSISSTTNKSYTESLNQSGRKEQHICFHGYINDKGGTMGRGLPPGEEKS